MGFDCLLVQPQAFIEKKKPQIAGGVILILLGVKILLEHLGVLA